MQNRVFMKPKMSLPPPSTPWVRVLQPALSPTARVFGVPGAGASAAAFRSLEGQLAEDIEVCGVELPGRGLRHQERAPISLGRVTAALAPALAPRMRAPFVLLGHGTGAALALDLAKVAERLRLPLERVVLFDCPTDLGRGEVFDVLARLDEGPFIEELETRRVAPSWLVRQPEVRAACLPDLRAEVEVLRHWQAPRDLSVDLTLVGQHHRVDGPWWQWTRGECEVLNVSSSAWSFTAFPSLLIEVLEDACGARPRTPSVAAVPVL